MPSKAMERNREHSVIFALGREGMTEDEIRKINGRGAAATCTKLTTDNHNIPHLGAVFVGVSMPSGTKRSTRNSL